jgi:uncharacterized protein YcfL
MKKSLSLALASIAILASCTSGITGQASYIGNQHEMSTETQNFVVGMRIALDDIKTTRVNDFLVANLQLRNKWPFSQDVQYRAHWFDETGIEIEPERAVWNKVILTGKSERTVKLTAPTTKAVEIKVTIRD